MPWGWVLEDERSAVRVSNGGDVANARVDGVSVYELLMMSFWDLC